MKRVSAGSTGHGRGGPDWHQARGRLPAHSRIHLFVRRGLPKDGTCVYLIMPRSDTACFQAFLNVLSRKFGRVRHRCGEKLDRKCAIPSLSDRPDSRGSPPSVKAALESFTCEKTVNTA